jgi:hypothetical protein
MSNKTRLVLDIGLLLAFLVAFSPGATGISVHEWLSLAIGVPTLIHLVINWDWVVRVAGNVLGKIRATSRVNLAVDMALFVATITVMLSGLLVSQVIATSLGLALTPDAIWYAVHSASATISVVLLTIHFALHAPWAVRIARGWLAPSPTEVAS